MIFHILLIILAFPLGFLIAWFARDELLIGRVWFQRLMILGTIIAGIFYVTGDRYATWSCFFIVIVAFIGYMKSFDKSWTRKIRK